MTTYLSTFHIGRYVLIGATPQEYVLDLEPFNMEGYFSLQGKGLAGDPAPFGGTVSASYRVSNDGINYFEPLNATAIFTGLGDSDDALASFGPPLCRYLKLIFTPDGSDISADFWLSIS